MHDSSCVAESERVENRAAHICDKTPLCVLLRVSRSKRLNVRLQGKGLDRVKIRCKKDWGNVLHANLDFDFVQVIGEERHYEEGVSEPVAAAEMFTLRTSLKHKTCLESATRIEGGDPRHR